MFFSRLFLKFCIFCKKQQLVYILTFVVFVMNLPMSFRPTYRIWTWLKLTVSFTRLALFPDCLSWLSQSSTIDLTKRLLPRKLSLLVIICTVIVAIVVLPIPAFVAAYLP